MMICKNLRVQHREKFLSYARRRTKIRPDYHEMPRYELLSAAANPNVLCRLIDRSLSIQN